MQNPVDAASTITSEVLVEFLKGNFDGSAVDGPAYEGRGSDAAPLRKRDTAPQFEWSDFAE